MIFEETKLAGAYVIRLQTHQDDRGFFARTFCQNEFKEHGLNPYIAQCNLSFNHHKGTLRGLHYQLPPAAEVKVMRCLQGAIYDVIVDLRPDSPTYLQHVGVELTDDNHVALYVPELFAHGYQALTDGAKAMYQVSQFYTPGQERGLHYADPELAIDWPVEVTTISDKDAAWGPLDREALEQTVT
ncbi:MAG: dTDP-4-dehydrorhamnose 3,5-epimerase [Deinococcota bacterium]